MNYKEFKETKSLETKAFKSINGVWTMAAYLISYRLKELLLILTVVLLFWIVTLIVNPSVAATIRYFIGKIL